MVKPDLILHIGLSKTGTSSIQRVLGARREALSALGVCYPLSPGWANHGLLPASLVPVDRLGHYNPQVWDGMTPEARLARFRAEFARELGAMPPGTRLLLISAEQMSGLLDTPASIALLRDLLAPHVAAARVIVYLRRQDSHFASGYTQGLRVGHVVPPVLPQAGPEKLAGYDYAALLDRWAQVFGEAAVTPRIFAPGDLLQGDAVDDFLAACGIALDVPKDDPDRQSNLSLTPGGIELVRAMAELLAAAPGGLHGASPLWRRFVQAANDHLPGRGWRPDPAEAAAFLARFEQVNEAVRARWFPHRATLFAPVGAAPAANPGGTPPIDRAAALEAACQLILKEASATAAREAQLHVANARLRERLGEQEEARAAWRSAIRAQPDHPVAQARLAELALAAGDRAGAEAHLAMLRAAHPDHAMTARVERLLAGRGPAAARAAAPRATR